MTPEIALLVGLSIGVGILLFMVRSLASRIGALEERMSHGGGGPSSGGEDQRVRHMRSILERYRNLAPTPPRQPGQAPFIRNT
jgi:hypothetical protein